MIEWKPIKGYENEYEVSNYGDFHIKRYEYIDKANRHIIRQEKWISHEELGAYGKYLGIYLGKLGKCYAHRIVAQTFLNNIANKPEVNHKDGNHKNNYCGCKELNYKDSNLEWVTRQENINHAVKLDLYNHDSELRKEMCRKNQKKSYVSHMCPVVQLTKNELKFVARYKSISEASRCTGYSDSGISSVVRHEGYHKTIGGYVFMSEKEYNNIK